jgi:hypothetical protein
MDLHNLCVKNPHIKHEHEIFTSSGEGLPKIGGRLPTRAAFIFPSGETAKARSEELADNTSISVTFFESVSTISLLVNGSFASVHRRLSRH